MPLHHFYNRTEKFALQRDVKLGDVNTLLTHLRFRGHDVTIKDECTIQFVHGRAEKLVHWFSCASYNEPSVPRLDDTGESITDDLDRMLFEVAVDQPRWHADNGFFVSLSCEPGTYCFSDWEKRDIHEGVLMNFALVDNVIYNRSQKDVPETEDVLRTDSDLEINVFVGYDFKQALADYTVPDEDACPSHFFDACQLACWRCGEYNHHVSYARGTEYDCFTDVLGDYVVGDALCCEDCREKITRGAPRKRQRNA